MCNLTKKVNEMKKELAKDFEFENSVEGNKFHKELEGKSKKELLKECREYEKSILNN